LRGILQSQSYLALFSLIFFMSIATDKLINSYKQALEVNQVGEKVKVNNVIGTAALVYEKVRNAIDYQEEHLLFKNAIHRILKRKLIFEKVILENYLLDKFHHENVAKQLVQELIRAGYVKGAVFIKKVEDVDKIIQKYNLLITKIKEVDGKISKKTFRYFLEIAAVEIEAVLIPADKEKALINAMFSVYNKHFDLFDQDVDEKQKELQTYLACHKVLFKWDHSMLSYLLLTLYYPKWKNADEELINKIANKSDKVVTEINKQITHPLQRQILKILQKKAIIFWVIQDVLEKNPKTAKQIFADQELLESEVKKAINRRYKGVRVKLRRGVVRSIIYVFFTKMTLALALELPMDYYLAGVINYTSLAINVIFPPFLMFVVAILIRMPKKENTTKIIAEINKISFKQKDVKNYKIKVLRIRGGVVRFIFNLIYALSFVFSLMIIFWGLNQLEFNFFSSLIFVLFLTLVSFFGIKIRRPVQELLAIDKRENIIGSIIDFFALPFVSMGRWMSGKFSKINFMAFFLDFIIEAPFKLLIEVFEDLFGFIREKKEEVMEE